MHIAYRALKIMICENVTVLQINGDGSHGIHAFCVCKAHPYKDFLDIIQFRWILGCLIERDYTEKWLFFIINETFRPVKIC